MNEAEWARRYEAEVLAALDPIQVLNDLSKLCDGRAAVLLCWEPEPPDPTWCHRALVSRWLHEQVGFELPELGHENLGYGCRHPKLPVSIRHAAT